MAVSTLILLLLLKCQQIEHIHIVNSQQSITKIKLASNYHQQLFEYCALSTPMPTVKPNNRQRPRPLNKTNPTPQHLNTKSQHTNKNSQVETINTSHLARKNCPHLHNENKTVKKTTLLENKPIIKDLNKRLGSLSQQYAPEYFKSILQYLLLKESEASISPTLEKITKWREFRVEERRIEEKVRREVRRIEEIIANSRKKIREEFMNEFQGEQIQEQHTYSSLSNSSLSNSSSSLHTSLLTSLPSHLTSLPSSLPSLHSSHHSSLHLLQTKQKIPQIPKINWDNKFDRFSIIIDSMLSLLGEQQNHNTAFPACYIFYMLVVSDEKTFNGLSDAPQTYNERNASNPNQSIEYYMVVSILIASKYHEICPFSLEDLIESVNETLCLESVLKYEGMALEMMNFMQFYSDHEYRFLRIFGTIVNWGTNELNICEFILESGLNNPKLYQYSPVFKAATVIGIYEQRFFNSQQKFNSLKTLIPNFTYPVAIEIKREYLQILEYNNANEFVAQKKKYFVFDDQMKRLMKSR